MPAEHREVVVGLDKGGTVINATVLDSAGRFLVDRLVETPSRVSEGPKVAVEALAESFADVLGLTGVPRSAVRAVGLDTPGPASADGVISHRGAVNFVDPAWRGFDVRSALEARLGLPVIYNNDANAAALYAHDAHFGPDAPNRSSVSLIVGTGLGGGVIEGGRVVRGAAGMAGEFGHVRIPLDGLLAEGQPAPVCNCGLTGDGESIASLTGIEKNLLPYWLTRYPGHELGKAGSAHAAAIQIRGYACREDPMALEIFRQQAIALGRLFTDRGEPHRPGRVLPRRWRRRGGAQLPRLVPCHRPRAHRPAGRTASPGDLRARAGPGHGRRPRRGHRGQRRARLATPRPSRPRPGMICCRGCRVEGTSNADHSAA